jgi:hypothetical protein
VILNEVTEGQKVRDQVEGQNRRVITLRCQVVHISSVLVPPLITSTWTTSITLARVAVSCVS